MPIRDVVIRLGLNAAPYVAGVKEAQLATAGLGTNITKTAVGGSKSAAVLGSSFGLVGLAAGAAGAQMISAAADFDAAMSSVKASVPASTAEIGKLRQAALDAGAATKFSATDAAFGIEALGKAGLKVSDVLSGGLKASLNLAAAENIDVAQAAEITATALSQFELKGQDATNVANRLAAGAYSAQGSVVDMAEGLKYAGPVAHAFGVSLDETTNALTFLATKGLQGSNGGTILRQMLSSLLAPTKLAKAEMDGLGISLYDARGKFIGLTPALQQFKENLPTDEQARNNALGRIFDTQTLSGAIPLINAGADGLGRVNDEMERQSSVADIAGQKMDNLKGDVENLKGSLDTLFIAKGEGAQSPLRSLVKSLTEITNTLGTEDSKFNLLNNFGDKRVANTGGQGSSAGADRQIKLTADISDITKKGNVADKIIDNVLQDRPTPVKADAKPAVKAAGTADRAINNVHQRTIPKITADAGPALEAVRVTLLALAGLPGLVSLGSIVPKKATGGPIAGPGSGTSDNVPIMASNGEHMWTARETEAVGGHGAMYRLRSAALSGSLPRFASGGPVGMTSNQWALEIARLQADMADNRSQLKTSKGPARRALELEYVESKAALRRLKGGLSSDYDFGLQSIVDARNAPVSLFGGVSDSPWMRNGNFASQAQQKLTQIKTLAGKLIELRKRGLAGGLIAEIAELGSGQGIAAADALLKSPGEIKQLSAAYSSIQGYNGIIAAAAYQPSSPGGGINVSIKDISFNLKKMSAEFDAVITDKAGKIIDRQHFNSTVGV